MCWALRTLSNNITSSRAQNTRCKHPSLGCNWANRALFRSEPLSRGLHSPTKAGSNPHGKKGSLRLCQGSFKCGQWGTDIASPFRALWHRRRWKRDCTTRILPSFAWWRRRTCGRASRTWWSDRFANEEFHSNTARRATTIW